MGGHRLPPQKYESGTPPKPIFRPSSKFITRLSPRAFPPRNWIPSRSRAGANGFARIRQRNIQFGSQTWTARLPAGSASGNFSRDALIATRSSSAFMSANNFGAVALAETVAGSDRARPAAGDAFAR